MVQGMLIVAIPSVYEFSFLRLETLLGRTYLSHVRDVKERRLSFGSAPEVFLHDAAVGSLVALVQDGQFVSGKGDHFSTQILVPLIQ